MPSTVNIVNGQQSQSTAVSTMAKRSRSAVVDLTGGSSDENDGGIQALTHHGAMPPAKRRRRGKFDKESSLLMDRKPSSSDDTASDANDDSDVELIENSAHNRPGRLKDDRRYDSGDDYVAKSPGTKRGRLKDNRKYTYEYGGGVDDDDQAESDRAMALALALQDEDEDRMRRQRREEEEASARYAARLQREEETKAAKMKDEEEKAMHESASGKAVLFVQKVLDAHKRLQSSTKDASVDEQIGSVARDDMVALVEQMLNLQSAFEASGKPLVVDIGFHYTTPQNLDKIRENGLMTRADRTARNVTAAPRGSVFGDGIYTGNNPYCFMNFGVVGLLVARLKGVVETSSSKGTKASVSANADTVIGNKRGTQYPYYDEVVLQRSAQCVPLARYSSSLIDIRRTNSMGNQIIHVYHRELQRITDTFFNGVKRTEVKEYITPSSAEAGVAGSTAAAGASVAAANAALASARAALVSAGLPPPPPIVVGTSSSGRGVSMASSGFGASAASLGLGLLPPLATAIGASGLRTAASRGRGAGRRFTPASSQQQGQREVISYHAPSTLSAPPCAFEVVRSPERGAECSICLDSLSTAKAVKIKCGHVFHKRCINSALSLTGKNSCPVCRKLMGEPQGSMPSGTMTITSSTVTCQGYQGYGSIVVNYAMTSGVQQCYMANPGQRFTGTNRTVYIPNNLEGRRLVKRLKYAFQRGLTFVVGTSMTTGQQNVVTWSSIHHKTNPSGGARAHGFPDPGYFANVNEELNNLGVPSDDQL